MRGRGWGKKLCLGVTCSSVLMFQSLGITVEPLYKDTPEIWMPLLAGYFILSMFVYLSTPEIRMPFQTGYFLLSMFVCLSNPEIRTPR